MPKSKGSNDGSHGSHTSYYSAYSSIEIQPALDGSMDVVASEAPVPDASPELPASTLGVYDVNADMYYAAAPEKGLLHEYSKKSGEWIRNNSEILTVAIIDALPTVVGGISSWVEGKPGKILGQVAAGAQFLGGTYQAVQEVGNWRKGLPVDKGNLASAAMGFAGAATSSYGAMGEEKSHQRSTGASDWIAGGRTLWDASRAYHGKRAEREPALPLHTMGDARHSYDAPQGSSAYSRADSMQRAAHTAVPLPHTPYSDDGAAVSTSSTQHFSFVTNPDRSAAYPGSGGWAAQNNPSTANPAAWAAYPGSGGYAAADSTRHHNPVEDQRRTAFGDRGDEARMVAGTSGTHNPLAAASGRHPAPSRTPAVPRAYTAGTGETVYPVQRAGNTPQNSQRPARPGGR